MNVTINDTSETRKDVVVTISGDEVSQEDSRILKSFIKQAKIPGFRQGKAPEARVRNLYKKEIQEELKNALMRTAYDQVINNEDINVYTIVDFPEPTGILIGQEVNLDLTVDVTPDFDLPEYKGIETKAPSTEVEDSEIDDTIDRIRRQRADFEVVEREAAEGDYVKLSYTGTVDGEEIAELVKDQPRLQAWSAVKDGWEEAGTEEAKEFGVPAIIDGLVGMKAEDKKTVEQEIAEDFAIEDLRGKTISYEIEVSEVRERKLPEMDEDFLKSVQAETVEDFKAQIMDQLEARKKQESTESQRQQILDFLGEAVDFALPQSAVEGATQQAMARMISQNMQMGVQEEEFEKHKEEIYAGAAATAARDVKLELILTRIAKEEEITVENEELSRAVYSMALQNQQKPEDLAKELRKDQNKVIELQRQVLFAKTLDLLLNESKATEGEPEAAPEAEEKSES
ncbi:MAG: trigger factor [Puniceicoccaceae bacterium]